MAVYNDTIDFDVASLCITQADVDGQDSDDQSANPGTVDAQSGWVNPDYVKQSDNLRASIELYPGTSSGSMTVTNFGFNVQSDASITGVRVGVEAREFIPILQPAIAKKYQLRYNNGNIGSQKTDYTGWGSTETTVYNGNSGDVWGAALTSQIVNDSSFGVSLYFTEIDAQMSVEVDNIFITVYWLNPATGVTVEEALSFDVSALLAVLSDLDGDTYDESLIFATLSTMTPTMIQEVYNSVTMSGLALIGAANDQERVSVKIIDPDGDEYFLDSRYVEGIREFKERSYQLNEYQDNSSSLYFTSDEFIKVVIITKPNTDVRDLIEQFRSETGNFLIYYNYSTDKSDFKVMRINPRAPLSYAHGYMDGDAFLQMEFNEQIT